MTLQINYSSPAPLYANKKLETIFGSCSITDPLIDELLQCKAVQRLQAINQFGVSFYLNKPYVFTRFGHSVGVFHLLKIYKRSVLEQVAGLLHDVSHTAFSHLADMVFDHTSSKNSYQDDIHQWYLMQTDIPEILRRYSISLDDVMHKKGDFLALEQDLPALCADRIEYLLHEAVLENMITHGDVSNILKNLAFQHNQWVFSSHMLARMMGDISLALTEYHFAAPINIMIYHYAAQAVKMALKHNIISTQQLRFSHDETIWDILIKSPDQEIKDLMNKCLNVEKHYMLGDRDNFDIHVCPKFRGVDPLVNFQGAIQRLTELDDEYSERFNALKLLLNKGFYIKKI